VAFPKLLYGIPLILNLKTLVPSSPIIWVKVAKTLKVETRNLLDHHPLLDRLAAL
jgi:hypothetical protein